MTKLVMPRIASSGPDFAATSYLPNVYMCVHTFTDTFASATASEYLNFSYAPNALFSVDDLGGNAQGAVKLTALYDKYQVFAFSWKIRFINRLAGTNFTFGAVPTDSSTAPVSALAFGSNQFARTKFAGEPGNGSASMVNISGFMKVDTLAGLKTVYDKDYAATSTANPATRVWLHLMSDNEEAVAAQKVQGYIVLKLYTKWFERKMDIDPDTSSFLRKAPTGPSYVRPLRPGQLEELKEDFEDLEMVEKVVDRPRGPAVKRRIVPSRV